MKFTKIISFSIIVFILPNWLMSNITEATYNSTIYKYNQHIYKFENSFDEKEAVHELKEAQILLSTIDTSTTQKLDIINKANVNHSKNAIHQVLDPINVADIDYNQLKTIKSELSSKITVKQFMTQDETNQMHLKLLGIFAIILLTNAIIWKIDKTEN